MTPLQIHPRLLWTALLALVTLLPTASAQESWRFRIMPVANSVSSLVTAGFWVLVDPDLREVYVSGTLDGPNGIAVVDIAQDMVVATVPDVAFGQSAAIHVGLHRIYRGLRAHAI